jgi:hypothetical protein
MLSFKRLTITASTFNLLIEIDFDFDPIAYRCFKNIIQLFFNDI